jgi:putative ABC transport system substrate-binding protein
MQFSQLRRRKFITLLGGGAAVWPFVARAQQRPAIPVVGFLQPGSAAEFADFARAFVQGLKAVGYVEGESVIIEYRWAEGRYEQLPRFAADLANRKVAVIAAGGPPATFAAKSVTSTIPIVFIGSDDSVRDGLVASLNRPGGNLTGMTVFTTPEMWGKRIELLRYLVPRATCAAILVNPQDTPNPDMTVMAPAALAFGLKLQFLTAATDAEIEEAFDAANERRIDALLVSETPFFTVRYNHIIGLAKRHALPAIYGWRQCVVAGGLMSYGSSLTDAWHQVGVYVGRILKGAKAADLPVMRPSRFEFVLNIATAKGLGLTVPDKLLALADEVIE